MKFFESSAQRGAGEFASRNIVSMSKEAAAEFNKHAKRFWKKRRKKTTSDAEKK